MKPLSLLQLQILNYLNDGKCHSGNTIGEQLKISRTAIWKQINQLVALGLKIERIPQKGYQLTQPFIPLQEILIRQQLKHPMKREIDFHLFSEIDSTNRYLRDLQSTPAVSICCAEKQTRGRGRFGRNWISPFGENIYLSSRWELNCCPSKLSGLSLVISLTILESLKKNHIDQDIRVKWPNDLLWKDKKLCGILIELTAETNGFAHVIIGIGLNVNTATQNELLTEKPWCSLYEITGKYFDRNSLIASILETLDTNLELFLQNGFGFFQERWQEYDYLNGQYISVSQVRGSMCGYASGVTDQGLLCLIDDNGHEHHLSSGDTSMSSINPALL